MNTIQRIQYIKGTDKQYQVTDTGIVYSLLYNKTKELKQSNVHKNDPSNPHKRVVLTYHDGSRRKKLVHRLVAEAFIPNPHNKPQINHKDGNKSNNHYKNLEWSTQSENMKHAYYFLGHRAIRQSDKNRKGEQNPAAKLSIDNINHIKSLAQNKQLSQRKIAKQFNVSQGIINRIINNKVWKQ